MWLHLDGLGPVRFHTLGDDPDLRIDQPHGPYDMDEHGHVTVQADLPGFPMTRFVDRSILSVRPIRYRDADVDYITGITLRFENGNLRVLDPQVHLPAPRPARFHPMSNDDSNTNTNNDDMFYAPHDSLEGLLQRGRGLGAVRARQSPSAATRFVYDGIRRDWAWDGLVDERALYLARSVRDLELSTAPIVEQFAGSADECSRAADVLVRLALGGSDEARDGLRAHIREGSHWVPVLESVADHLPDTWWEDLGEVARARIGREPEPPWKAEPWVRFGVEVRRIDPCPAPPDLGGHTEGELLGLLTRARSGDRIRVDALRELGRRDPTEALIPLVPSLATPDGRRPLPLLTRAVEHLGALAVPAARNWADDERPWLARLGRGVLADQVVPEALPVLLAELAEQRRTHTWCGPAATAERLARFGPAAAEAVADLRRLWLHTPHSYERPAYLKALAAIDADGLDHAHTESLRDCQEQARLLGIAHAPDNPTTQKRIAELRDDPMEDPDVRAAAAARQATP